MSSSKLSNLSWAELRDRARRIGRHWSSEELPTGNATTVEEQLSVVQVDSEGEVERRAEKPDVEEVLAIEPPATEELPNVTNKQQQFPTASVTTTATSPPTQFAAVGQPPREKKRNKAAEVSFVVVTEEEGGLASFVLVPDKERTITPEQEKRRRLAAFAVFPSKENTFVFEKEPKDEIAGSIATPNRPANWRFRKKKVRPSEGGRIAVASLPSSRRYLEPLVGLGEAKPTAATVEIQTAKIGESRLSSAEPHVTISRRKEELASIDAESNAATNRIVARGREFCSLLAELSTATAGRNELEKKPMIRTATGSEARLARQARRVSLPATRSGYGASQSTRNPTGTAIDEKKEAEHSPENGAKRLPSKKMTATIVAASTVEKTVQESGRGVCWSPRHGLGSSLPREEPPSKVEEVDGDDVDRRRETVRGHRILQSATQIVGMAPRLMLAKGDAPIAEKRRLVAPESTSCGLACRLLEDEKKKRGGDVDFLREPLCLLPSFEAEQRSYKGLVSWAEERGPNGQMT
ncbi:unnamed protein product [Linum trigynum]|uniref:Uncharacterized protein n=1 Tax=Linum trigynum TaxID=586398 RepID=A0AAV2G8R0_9ROSI